MFHSKSPCHTPFCQGSLCATSSWQDSAVCFGSKIQLLPQLSPASPKGSHCLSGEAVLWLYFGIPYQEVIPWGQSSSCQVQDCVLSGGHPHWRLPAILQNSSVSLYSLALSSLLGQVAKGDSCAAVSSSTLSLHTHHMDANRGKQDPTTQ